MNRTDADRLDWLETLVKDGHGLDCTLQPITTTLRDAIDREMLAGEECKPTPITLTCGCATAKMTVL